MRQLRLFDLGDEDKDEDDAAVDEIMERLRHWHDDRKPDRWIRDVPTGGLL